MFALIVIAVVTGCEPATDDLASGWAMHVIDNTLSGADGVDLFDIDADGDLDAVVGWEESNALRLYLNPGVSRVRSAWPAVDISGGVPVGKIEDARFADLNDDGVIDAVFSAAEKGSERIAAHWLRDAARPGRASSWEGQILEAAPRYRYIKLAFGDLDGNGVADVIAGAKADDAPGALLWIRANVPGESPLHWQAAFIDEVEWVDSVLIRDINGDGLRDILMNHNGFLGWFRNPGEGAGRWSRQTISERTGPYFAACSTGDAALMLVTGTDLSQHQPGRRALYLIMQDASSESGWAIKEIASRLAVPRDSEDYAVKGLACGNLDDDPLPDIAVSVSGQGVGLFALMNLDPGSSEPLEMITIGNRRFASYKGIKHDNVVMADIDNDGDLDLITTEENGRRPGLFGYFRPEGMGTLWYENPLL